VGRVLKHLATDAGSICRAPELGEKDRGLGAVVRSAFTISVPPGASRSIHLANLGDPWEIAKRRSHAPPPIRPADATDYCGAWATWPPQQDTPFWIEPDQHYRVSLTLAGLNFNAKHYEGELVADLQEPDVPGYKNAISIWIEWSEPLAET
jgi:hypothetical protein